MEKIVLITERGNNMKFNNKVPRWLVVLGFAAGVALMIASTIETVMLFKSMSTGWIAYMYAMIGFCIDIGKTVTFALFVYFLLKKKLWSSLLFSSFYILCLLISMVASQSLDLNKVNEIQNDTVLSSESYSMNISAFDNANEDVIYYRNKIKQVQSSERARIEAYTAPLLKQKEHAKKNDWITTTKWSTREGVDVIDRKLAGVPSKVKSEISSEISALEEKISKAQERQSSSKRNIDELKAGGGIKTTDGLIAFGEWLNPENPSKALASFNLFKNVFREILGILLIMLYNYQFESAQSRKRAEIQPKQSDELSRKRASKPSNQADKKEFTKEEVERYIEAKKKYPTMGHKPLSKKADLSEGKCSKIQVHLKKKGILKKSGNTYKVG